MSVYTCITCRVAFADAELQRAHYKTDWHRYNLKRKVAEMPPVTAENFQQRVLSQRAQVADQEKDTARNCQICGKHFSTENAFDNHIKSRKHKEMEAKQGKSNEHKLMERNEKNSGKSMDMMDVQDKDAINRALQERLQGQGSEGQGSQDAVMGSDDDHDDAGSDDDAWEANQLGIEECLFCSHVSASLEDNVSHMTIKHSFFIPDVEFLEDLDGLIGYLGEKVGVGHICLWCNEAGRAFRSTPAVQKHMLDKGHCKLLHDGDVVYEYADFYDYRSSYVEGEGQAAGGEAAAGDSMAIDMVEPEILINDGYQLVLPSGATVGHRSLFHYYRQNLPATRTNTRSIVPRMLAQYRGLGWVGAKGEVTRQRVKDLGFMQRLKHRHFMRLGCKANKLQHHYREQNPI